MVRKTTRSLKAAEKTKSDSPRRSRRTTGRYKKSGSKSDDSEEDISKEVNKNISPVHEDRDSSEDESDKDSKKPLKKRTRSMAVKEESQQSGSQSKSRWDKEQKMSTTKSDQQDEKEEVKEEQNSKGKSKKNNSSNDNVIPETENENVQVTDESPSDVKDENLDTQIKNGKSNIECDVDKVENNECENTDNQQCQAVNSKQYEQQDNQLEQERLSGNLSEDQSNNSPLKNSDRKETSENQYPEKESIEETSEISNTENNKLVDNKDNSEEKIKESIEEKSEAENGGKTETSKKLRLKRSSTDKHSAADSGNKKEDSFSKKITLKRPDTKPILEDSAQPVGSNDTSPKEQTPSEEWTSTYETTVENVDYEKNQDKRPRKRITLKRSNTEENKAPAEKNVENLTEKKEVLARRDSLVEKKNENDNNKQNSTRRSSAFERSASENEEKQETPKKPVKVVKLNRFVLKESQEPRPSGEEVVKKYKWGQSNIDLSLISTLTFQTLKEICPSIEMLKEDEVDLDLVIKDNKTIKERRKTFNELEEEEMEKIEAELNAEPEDKEMNENIIAMNRKISIVDDTAGKLAPPPSPAKNPVSEVLFITNLVRPFTVKQLKELLERTGKIREDGFWTDRIKSKCYVCYEKLEEAEATRNALHGVNWPIGNGKKLIIDYATVEDLENAKNPPLPIKKEKTPEIVEKRSVVPEEVDVAKKSRSDVREWDMDKEDHRRRRSRSRSVERQRKYSRRSYTPEDYHSKKRKHEEPVPQKAMDDLFLKTKATPSIYWQPLSPEEIALKQQQRQARLEENKRRLEEISRTSSRGTRDRGRDRNFRRR